jgi:hypothetical protein
MKTTLDIPDDLFRRVKATAALEGCSLKDFVSRALEHRLAPAAGRPDANGAPPWMRGFGALADLAAETRRIDRRIAEEFRTVEPEDRM